MMTVITEITIEPGQEPKWDEAFRQRVEDVSNQAGWLGIQLLIPLDAPNKRVVVGSWRSRADWEAWHNTKSFQRTRELMDGVKQSSSEDRWYEVVSNASVSD